MARSSSAAQRDIIRSHALRFSPRSLYDSIARVTSANADVTVDVVSQAAPGILPLLADLYEYTVGENRACKPRRDLLIRQDAASSKTQTLRCWTAVLPWEMAYGLSRCPVGLLGSDGSVTGHPSGMVFIQPPAMMSTRVSYWSGAITTPLDVSFAVRPPRPTAAWPVQVTNVGRLDPFPEITDGPGVRSFSARSGNTVHSVQSATTGVACILETAAGAVDIGPQSVLQPSENMILEIKEKHDLMREVAGPLCDCVNLLVDAISRRCVRIEHASVPLLENDVLLLSLALRLGIQSEALFDTLETKLVDDVRAALLVEGQDTQEGHHRQGGLSDTALATVGDLVDDLSVSVPETLLQVAWEWRRQKGTSGLNDLS